MVERTPPAGSRGIAVAAQSRTTVVGSTADGRIPPNLIDRLNSTFICHSAAISQLTDISLKRSLTDKLEIAGLELKLLERRAGSSDLPSSYQLADLYQNITTSLNSIRTETLIALGYKELSIPEAIKTVKVGFLELSLENLAVNLVMQERTELKEAAGELSQDIEKYSAGKLDAYQTIEVHKVLEGIAKQELRDLDPILALYQAGRVRSKTAALLGEELPTVLEITQPVEASPPIISPATQPVIPADRPTDPAPPPVPEPIEVTPQGAKPAQSLGIRQSKFFLRWKKTLDTDQLEALEYLIGFERGALSERIFATQEIMEKPLLGDKPAIDFVLTAISQLLKKKIEGLPLLLEKLSWRNSQGRERNLAETQGAAYELIRLSHIARLAPGETGSLTNVEMDLGQVEFYPENIDANGRKSKTLEKLLQTIDADGFRSSSRTLIEIKFYESELTFNPKDRFEAERMLHLKNQARKYGAAIKMGLISSVEYHITTPKLDIKLIEYLTKVIGKVTIHHYTSLFNTDPFQLEYVNLGSAGTAGPVKDKVAPSRKNKDWDEDAWLWAAKFATSARKVKSFNGDPRNVRKAYRQVQYQEIMDGLQVELDGILQIKRISAADRSQAEDIKHDIFSNWRARLNDNSAGVAVIRDFSQVIRQVIDLSSRTTQ